MSQVPLQWHPAFCSSLQIELAGEPLEFKSPDDKLSINEYYKVLGYACIYQANEYRENQSDPLYSTCMDVIMRANQEHYKKEGAGMCEAIRELMFEFYGEQLEADRAKMRQEICREVRQEVCQEVRQEVRKEVCQEVFQELFKALEEDTRFLAILKQIQEKYS